MVDFKKLLNDERREKRMTTYVSIARIDVSVPAELFNEFKGSKVSPPAATTTATEKPKETAAAKKKRLAAEAKKKKDAKTPDQQAYVDIVTKKAMSLVNAGFKDEVGAAVSQIVIDGEALTKATACPPSHQSELLATIDALIAEHLAVEDDDSPV